MRSLHRFLLVVGTILLVPRAGHAQAGYTIQPLLRGGDRAGSFTVCNCSGSYIGVAGINDAGQASFFAQDSAHKLALLLSGPGGLTPIIQANDRLGGSSFQGLVNSDAVGPDPAGRVTFVAKDGGGHISLLQSAAGTLATIATEGGAAPGGMWKAFFFDTGNPLSVNDHGDVVFNAVVTTATGLSSGTFVWNAEKQQLAPVNLQGLPLGGGLTVTETTPYHGALINNADEVVVGADGKDSAGKDWQGLLLLGRDQKPHLIAVDGQALPGGGTLHSFGISDVVFNDQDTVAFVAPVGDKRAVYQWANGTLSATGLAEGAAAPGGGPVAYIDSLWLNNLSSSVLIAARLNDPSTGRGGYYLFDNGQLKSIAAPGQQMPDGVATSGFLGSAEVSRPNAAGELAFITGLLGSSAAYRLEPDGRIALIVRSGISTGLGSLTQVGSTTGSPNGIALNDKGQVVLRASLDQHDAVLLLTPTGP